MTSNIGSRQLKDFGQGVGFTTSARKNTVDSDAKNVIEKALKKAFAPEFLNRIDDVILFNQLKEEDIHKIIDIELEALFARVTHMGYHLKIDKKAKEFIADKGYDVHFGARPLKRAIQKYLEDVIAEEIINSHLEENDTIKISLDEKNMVLKVKILKPKNK